MDIVILANTIKYLKVKQIIYRIYYNVRNKYRKLIGFSYLINENSDSVSLKISTSIKSNKSYEKNVFIFLNKRKKFNKIIDWDFNDHGKLWLYNLNYFDYLQQESLRKEEGLKLIYDFIDSSDNIKDGMMPFPISLRGVNWIKFLIKYNIVDEKINNSLYMQYYILLDNLEYHILGNHLLENGFSLLFGAYYFDDATLHEKAKEILFTELEEQILSDGAHFELSPMYHQIMLFRILDCINLLQNNLKEEDTEFLQFLQQKASMMLSWLNNITFQDGSIPLLNDSTNGIAPTSKELFEYASRLSITYEKMMFDESGYRKFKNTKYEYVVDVGNIGPDYIPGHAHADTFNFVLYVDNHPFIVDTGISTYETNERRILERSTSSHNTVEIDGLNQSEVWGGFRVARRAKIVSLKENDNLVEATHDGYKRRGVLHTRKFVSLENIFKIKDKIESNKEHKCVNYLHFYPGLEPNIKNNEILINNIKIKIKHYDNIQIENYLYAKEFNLLIEAKRVKIMFTKNLKMEIMI
jgi:hypothetical protein